MWRFASRADQRSRTDPKTRLTYVGYPVFPSWPKGMVVPGQMEIEAKLCKKRLESWIAKDIPFASYGKRK